MADPNHLSMTTSDVIFSADYLSNIGFQASTERRTLATELSGQTDAWQQDGKPGFLGFIGEVNGQADRLQRELGDVADWLRLAAREYTATAQEGAEALRYHRSGPSPL